MTTADLREAIADMRVSVELLIPFAAGRIRLAKFTEDKRRYIQPFLANTALGCAIYTDASRSHDGISDRKHFPSNLSAKDALPAHIKFEGIHRVFSNLKRWGLPVHRPWCQSAAGKPGDSAGAAESEKDLLEALDRDNVNREQQALRDKHHSVLRDTVVGW